MTEIPPRDVPYIDGDGTSSPPIPWHARLTSRINHRYAFALLDQGVYSLGNFVIYALMKRNNSMAEYGIFYLALRGLDLFNQLYGVLIWGPMIFNLSAIKDDLRYARYLGSNLAHQIVGSVLGVVLLVSLAAVSHARGGSAYDPLFLPLIVPSILIMLREFTRRIYFAQMRFGAAFRTDSATTLLQVAAMAWLASRHAVTYSNTLWALCFGCFFTDIYCFWTERRHFRFSLRDIRSDFRLNLQLGRWFLGSNMLFVVSQQANPWLLSGVLGPGSVGNYAICEQVINFPRVALTSMQNAMAPSMARAAADGGKSTLAKVVRRMDILLISGTAFMVALIIAFGPWVQRVIFHATANQARLVLGLLAFNLLAYAAALAQSYGLTAINRAQLNVYAAAIGLAAQLVVAVAVVRPFGVPGVAFALLIGNSVVLAARIVYYMREMRRP